MNTKHAYLMQIIFTALAIGQGINGNEWACGFWSALALVNFSVHIFPILEKKGWI